MTEQPVVARRSHRGVEGLAAHAVSKVQLRHGFEHRDIDRQALAGAFAAIQTGGDCIGRTDAHDPIYDRGGDIARHIGPRECR